MAEPQQRFSVDQRQKPRRPAQTGRRADRGFARAVVLRSDARQHPPLGPRYRRRQSAVVRARTTRRKRTDAPPRRRRSSSRSTARSAATWADCRACTRCSPESTCFGIARCCSATSSRPRRGSRIWSSMRPVSPAARSSRSIAASFTISAARWSPRAIAGAFAPSATPRASAAPSTTRSRRRRRSTIRATT